MDESTYPPNQSRAGLPVGRQEKAENLETILNILDISFWFTLYIVLSKF